MREKEEREREGVERKGIVSAKKRKNVEFDQSLSHLAPSSARQLRPLPPPRGRSGLCRAGSGQPRRGGPRRRRRRQRKMKEGQPFDRTRKNCCDFCFLSLSFSQSESWYRERRRTEIAKKRRATGGKKVAALLSVFFLLSRRRLTVAARSLFFGFFLKRIWLHLASLVPFFAGEQEESLLACAASPSFSRGERGQTMASVPPAPSRLRVAGSSRAAATAGGCCQRLRPLPRSNVAASKPTHADASSSSSRLPLSPPPHDSERRDRGSEASTSSPSLPGPQRLHRRLPSELTRTAAASVALAVALCSASTFSSSVLFAPLPASAAEAVLSASSNSSRTVPVDRAWLEGLVIEDTRAK